MGKLYKRLMDYAMEDIYPMHMPGHKRNSEYPDDKDILSDVLSIDITEINGFDNLNEPEGIIKEAQIRAAKLYNSDNTHFLVNGSTVGILSAVSAIADRGNTLIIARNCHKAVYNAAFINKLNLKFVYPSFDEEYDINGEISANDIMMAIENTDNIAGIVITSPTYDGVVSKVKDICDTAHKRNIPVIVDEAHGAHFGFSDCYPKSSVLYADIVIHSVHKTLASPTQTALIHINSKLIADSDVTRFLRIYQTSSPSYILMAGIDRAMDIVEKEGSNRLESLYKYRRELEATLANLNKIKICPYTEPGKLVISIKNTNKTGLWLAEELRSKYKIEIEMAGSTYVLAILTMMDTYEGIKRLTDALINIDEVLSSDETNEIVLFTQYPNADTRISIYEALSAEVESVDIIDAVGRIAGDYINLYPPGYPIVIPGELINRDIISIIEKYINCGFQIQGISENMIKVVKWGN